MRALLLAGVVMLGWAGAACAQTTPPMNQPPPSGNVVLDLNGTAIPKAYQQYTTAIFTAAAAATNISFSFRDDQAFLFLDDVTVRDVTTGAAVPVVNGGFESGPVGSNTPAGWTHLNTFGAGTAGIVNSGDAHTGNNEYFDGAIQAYDAITQSVATTAGDNYTINFFLEEDSSLTTFSRLSTNGDTTDQRGNGVDLLVYAGTLPTATAVPEPASLALLGTGLVGLAVARRRRGPA